MRLSAGARRTRLASAAAPPPRCAGAICETQSSTWKLIFAVTGNVQTENPTPKLLALLVTRPAYLSCTCHQQQSAGCAQAHCACSLTWPSARRAPRNTCAVPSCPDTPSRSQTRPLGAQTPAMTCVSVQSCRNRVQAR